MTTRIGPGGGQCGQTGPIRKFARSDKPFLQFAQCRGDAGPICSNGFVGENRGGGLADRAGMHP